MRTYVPVSVSLPPDLHEKAELRAQELGFRRATYIQQLILADLKRAEAEGGALGKAAAPKAKPSPKPKPKPKAKAASGKGAEAPPAGAASRGSTSTARGVKRAAAGGSTKKSKAGGTGKRRA